MDPQIPEYISIAFFLLVILLFFLVVSGYVVALRRSGMDAKLRKKKSRRLVIGLVLWLALLARVSTMDFFHDWSAVPPRLVLAVLPPILFAIYLVVSPKTMEWLKYVPAHWLVLTQSFRILMELILLFLFIEHIIPVQMTFEGRNFDILTGITALMLGYFMLRGNVSGKFIIGWNFFGLILLINIVVIAILSAPLPWRYFKTDPANTMVAYFPFVWLPGFVVPVAYTMHFLSIKKSLDLLHTHHS